MGEHNNAIAIILFFMVLFVVASIFIPIGAKEGWFDKLWDYIIHGNHPEEKQEEVPEDDETTEPNDNDNTDPTEMVIYYTVGDSSYYIRYKN